MLMKLRVSRQIFGKCSNIKFHENPSSGSRFVPCGRTDVTKLIVAFRNFANAPANDSTVPKRSALSQLLTFCNESFFFYSTLLLFKHFPTSLPPLNKRRLHYEFTVQFKCVISSFRRAVNEMLHSVDW